MFPHSKQHLVSLAVSDHNCPPNATCESLGPALLSLTLWTQLLTWEGSSSSESLVFPNSVENNSSSNFESFWQRELNLLMPDTYVHF
jgi:hypothetical protein